MANITLIHDADINRRASQQAKEGDFRDCELNETLPDTTHDYTQANAGVLVPGGKGSEYERRGLFWYDLKTFIPASASITAAAQWLYVATNTATGSMSFQLIRIRRNDEASGNHWKEAEATYNSYKSGSSWASPGASDTTSDRDTSVFKTIGDITGTGWQSWDCLSLVSDAWNNQAGICTFILERSDGFMTTAGHIQYHCKEYEPYGALSHHLRVTYTLDSRTFQSYVFDSGVAAAAARRRWPGLHV